MKDFSANKTEKIISTQKCENMNQKNIEHNDLHLFKVENYKCNHGCNHSFKTKKQMILHHDKIDNYCFNEKKLLIRLIESYQNSVDKILAQQNSKKFKNTKEYQYLQQQLKRAKECAIDKIQLESLIEEEVEYNNNNKNLQNK